MGMKKAPQCLYITADHVGTPTGGGSVTYHELKALRALGEVQVISRQEMVPLLEKLPNTPFLQDYVASYLLRDARPNLVHIYGGCFSQTVRLLKERGATVTYTAAAHDRRLSIEEFARLGLAYPYSHIADEYLWQMYLSGYKMADLVICPSEQSARLMREYGCVNVKVIPHGCEVPPSSPPSPAPAPPPTPYPDQFTAGYLGQVGPDKGLVYLLRAWALFPLSREKLLRPGALFPPPRGKLLIAGPGTETLGWLVQETGARNVELLGFIPSVEDFYKRITVYVQPSITESFGLEVLEAMARGRPVIVSEGTGARDCIVPGETGLVVPIRNSSLLAGAITYLYGQPQLVSEMGRKAVEQARKFTWDKVQASYVKTWKELLGVHIAVQAGTEAH